MSDSPPPQPQPEAGADELALLIGRARGVDGHPPFSDGALAELATGSRELLWIDDVAAAVRSIAPGTVEAEFVVDPDARRQGHGRAMLHRLLSEAPGEVLLWAHGGHPAARRLAAQHGLEPVRELLQLRRLGGLGGSEGVSIRPAGYSTGDRGEGVSIRPAGYSTGDRGEGVSIRPLGYSTGVGGGADDVVALLRVNARAFAEHPEQGRLTRAEFDALAAERWFDPEDVLLAWDSDRLIGFCWLKVEGDTGEFYVVGVDPDYQGQGWGRELVRAGLGRLASRGIRDAHLYVEADNAAALRLYREFGFAEHSIDIQYRWAGGPWE